MIAFAEDGLSLDVRFDPEKETVWLTQAEMAELFGINVDTVGLHLRNIYRENELSTSTYEESSVVRYEGRRQVRRTIRVYDLDAILSVGYRVNSKRGIAFRRWANSVLKSYLTEGYALNDKRLRALDRTVEVQRALITHYAEGAGADADEVIAVLDRFTSALNTLDDYDHQRLAKPKKSDHIVAYLSEQECRDIIKKTSFNQRGDLFGREKDKGLLKGILDQVAQYVFGEELYPSIEEKAANLLYFLVKDHVFVDGNKRIAALLYLAFLHKNGMLVKRNCAMAITNDGLAALTILIAESKPEEKEIMVAVTMNMTGR
ncbi:MAG: type II toxin-antitoxin system death-on-curing family toxin [Bacilli bacterium]|nr:type II toxin-antitoxin system death-on-curing family toxin [Bacilli bacterium]